MDIDTLKGLHWQTLKKMMEDAGLEFKSKDQAIEELAKLQPPAADHPLAADPDANQPTDPAAGDPPPADPAAIDPPPADAAPAVEEPAPAPRFDRRKPYGEISGDIPESPGARFVQGGLYFNNAGDVVGKA